MWNTLKNWKTKVQNKMAVEDDKHEQEPIESEDEEQDTQENVEEDEEQDGDEDVVVGASDDAEQDQAEYDMDKEEEAEQQQQQQVTEILASEEVEVPETTTAAAAAVAKPKAGKSKLGTKKKSRIGANRPRRQMIAKAEEFGFTRASMGKLFLRAGIKRKNKMLVELMRNYARNQIRRIAHRAVIYAEHARRATIDISHVNCALTSGNDRRVVGVL